MSWKDDKALDAMYLRVINARRAVTSQTFDEARKKLGSQWEASRLITIASSDPANNAYSIILTGGKAVELKSRVFGYTGEGVIGRIYKAPSFSGGSNDPWHNLNTAYVGQQPMAQLKVGFTLTATGPKAGADVYGIGPLSNQSQGATPQEFGSRRILEPMTAYLLEIASRDPNPQSVFARIEMYEGDMDLPSNDYE